MSEDSFNAGVRAAHAFVAKRLENYINAHGIYDPSTRVMEFPGNGDEYVGELVEIAEGIEALMPQPEPFLEEDWLPEWATAKADPNRLVLRQQLYTKDGSITGNAAIFDMHFDMQHADLIFHVITDAGSVSKYTLSELLNRFNPGRYLLANFAGDKDGSILEYYEG